MINILNLPHFCPTNTGQAACRVIGFPLPFFFRLYQNTASFWNEENINWAQEKYTTCYMSNQLLTLYPVFPNVFLELLFLLLKTFPHSLTMKHCSNFALWGRKLIYFSPSSFDFFYYFNFLFSLMRFTLLKQFSQSFLVKILQRKELQLKRDLRSSQ